MRGIRSTDVRREPDPRLLAEGLRGPNLDTRQWVDYGTVASVSERDGQPDFSDQNAIVISPEGVDVDVVFGTSQTPITCRYGTQCGVGVILTPIRPGDLVLVAVPGGELGNVPVILQVIPGPHTPLPLESEDHKPVFRNDRVSIMARGVPIEIRTTGGGKVTIDEDEVTTTGVKIVEQSDDVRLVDKEAAEQLVLGTTYRGNEGSMNNAVAGALPTLSGTLHAAVSLPTALTAIQALATFIDTVWLPQLQGFEAAAAQYLSSNARTK